MRTITCIITEDETPTIGLGFNNKNRVYAYLDSDNDYITIISSIHLLAVDVYCKENNCNLKVVYTFYENHKKVSKELQIDEAHYLLNKEYLALSNEWDELETEEL